MYKTGKMYDLESTTLMDDRFDPILATDAACRHMLDLYEVFGDWSMVLAAYNCGSGNVSRAIKRSGGKTNYWELQPYLPLETRGYVPAFIAVAYAMTYAAQHNLYPVHPGYLDADIDTFTVKGRLTFDQINAWTGIPVNEIEFLNPAFVRAIIPATDTDPMTIRIPSKYARAFLAVEDSLYVRRSGMQNEVVVQSLLSEDRTVYHYVRSGESLGMIAKKYGCSASDLMTWNKLRSTTIHPRQRLAIHLKPANQANTARVESPNPNVNQGESKSREEIKTEIGSAAPKANINKIDSKYIYHTVKRGDTLWGIAKRYDGVSVEDIRQVNNINSDRSLKPGQKLRIPSKG
jgi:membrane-bound lytic murein transglycosylase D